MWGDGYNSNLIFAGAVTPEHSIRSWRFVLRIGFEDFVSGVVGVRNYAVFVCLETRMSRISRQEFECFENLFENVSKLIVASDKVKYLPVFK